MNIFKYISSTLLFVATLLFAVRPVYAEQVIIDFSTDDLASVQTKLADADQSEFEISLIRKPSNAGVIAGDLVDALRPHADSIVKVDIAGTSIEDLTELEPLLGQASHLKFFSTRYSSNTMDDTCYELIAELMGNWKELKVLLFSEARFNNRMADIILPCLNGHESLKALGLGHCGNQLVDGDCLSYKSAPLLADVIDSCPNLMALNLCGTSFQRASHLEKDEHGKLQFYFAEGDIRLDREGGNIHQAEEGREVISAQRFLHGLLGDRNLDPDQILYDGLYYFTPSSQVVGLKHMESLMKGLPEEVAASLGTVKEHLESFDRESVKAELKELFGTEATFYTNR